jgi:signal transduction protein with GAF and PtsI domain
MSANKNPFYCLDMVHRVTHAFSGMLDEKEIIEVLLSESVAALNAQAALLRLLNPDGDELLLAGSVGLSEDYLQKGPIKLDQSSVDLRVMGGEEVQIEDVTHDPGFQYPQAASQEGLHGMVAVPLTVRNHHVGVLRVYVKQFSEVDEMDLALLHQIADMGALSLERYRLQQSLYRIAEALNSSLEIKTLLQRVLAAVVQEMEIKAGSIRLLDKKKQVLRLVAYHGLSQAYLSKGDVHLTKSPVDRRAMQGETVVLLDVEQEAGFEYPQEAADEGIRSVLVVPLVIKERTLGIMRVYSARPRHFGKVAIRFLTSVAGLVATAIENAELHAALQASYDDLKLDLADWYNFLALG